MCVGPFKKKGPTLAEKLLGNRKQDMTAPPPAPGPAATAVAGERIEGNPTSRGVFGGQSILNLANILGIALPRQSPTDPNVVAAGRIGRSYGASDLRIGG
jgi:hypothetical protein